jgi:predicted RNase H-like HicB family nuclease
MEKPRVLQFIIQAEDGGYSASAVGYSIYTQGETLDETIKNIKEAVSCHFDDENTASPYQPPIMVNFEVPNLA